MRNHKESLDLAEQVYNGKKSNLWTVVISYYSMFYIANAVIYKRGLKIGSKIAHKITADALIDLVRDKLKQSLLEGYEEVKEEAMEIAGVRADEIISSFDKEREKRSIFQYETTEQIKASKAATSFQRAKEFSLEMYNLLDELEKKAYKKK
jgi:uncharacterized protein (UPF0332 family)